jgi:hypothetical protein
MSRIILYDDVANISKLLDPLHYSTERVAYDDDVSISLGIPPLLFMKKSFSFRYFLEEIVEHCPSVRPMDIHILLIYVI